MSFIRVFPVSGRHPDWLPRRTTLPYGGHEIFGSAFSTGQSGEAHVFPIQNDKLTVEVTLRRSILQFTLRKVPMDRTLAQK
jgi:hypothetical protein